MAASRSDVIALVDTVGVVLGSRKKHFFADTEVAVSVAWLHDFAFFEYFPFNIRCRAEVLRLGVLGEGGVVLPAFCSQRVGMFVIPRLKSL